MVNVEELLERVYKVAGFSEQEKSRLSEAIQIDSEKSKIEGDDGKAILGKIKTINSESFILNDPETKDRVFKRAQAESMPPIEQSSRKILQDVFGKELLPDSVLDEIYKNPENKHLNNKLYHVSNHVKEVFSGQLEQVGKKSPELLEQIKNLQGIVKTHLSTIDTLKKGNSQEVEKVRQKYKSRIIDEYIIKEGKRTGADIAGMEKGFALQLKDQFHFDVDEDENVFVRQKSQPDLKVTDQNSGTTLTASQVVALAAAPRIDRSGKNQNPTGQKPKHEPGQGQEEKTGRENPYDKGTAAYRRWEQGNALRTKERV